MYDHIEDPVQQRQNEEILKYVTSLFSADDPGFLSPAEQSHMQDVRRLFFLSTMLLIACVGIITGTLAVFAYFRMWPNIEELISRSFRATGWTLLAICFVLGLASLLNFEKLWILFHVIVFPQGNWMFSQDSALITLYPGDFFQRFVIWWSALVVLCAIAAVVIGYFMDRMRKAEQEFNYRHRGRG
jgi:integral membrane protein (TIGR01906 family)